MASPAFKRPEAPNQPEVDSLEAFLQSTKVYSGLLTAAPQFEVRAQTQTQDNLHISRLEALRGAKSAIVAIAIEAAVVLCFFGVWQAWRMIR
jgi:hypothetical protein